MGVKTLGLEHAVSDQPESCVLKVFVGVGLCGFLDARGRGKNE
jgi:hypothetical protein